MPIASGPTIIQVQAMISGSVAGLLVGGVPVSSENPLPVSGTVGVTGSVGITGSVAVSNFPAAFGATQSTTPWIVSGSGWTPTVTGSVGLSGPITGTVSLASAVQVASGSVVGLLVGGQPVSQANPLPITGSDIGVEIKGGVNVFVSASVPTTASVTQGTVPWIVSGSSWTPTVTGSVVVLNRVDVTGSVGVAGPVAISNFPAVQNVTGSAWTPTITGSVVVANRVDVTGSVGITAPVAVSNFPAIQNVTGSAWTPTVTGSVVVSNRVDVTGSVGITAPVAVSNFPATQNVTGSAWTPTVTGSVVVSNRVDVTGSVGITAPVAVSNFPATQNVTGSAWTPTITGSVVVSNRVDVTGSVGIAGPITGSVTLSSAPTVNQGSANAVPWAVTGSVQIVSGGLGAQVLDTAPGGDTGQPALAVRIISSVGGGSQVSTTSGSVVGLLVGGVAVSTTNPVPTAGPVTGYVSASLYGMSVGDGLLPVAVDREGRVITVDAGTASGSNSGIAFGDIVAGATFAAIRRTAYTEQTGSFFRSLISSSSQDRNDAPGNGGAQKVRITYLDATGAGPFTEIVNMSGTTPSNTVNSNICFIEELEVTSVGISGSNQGLISLYQSRGASGSVFATIALNDNRTFWAHHYVAATYTGSITNVSANDTGTAAASLSTFRLVAQARPTGSSPQLQISDSILVPGIGTQINRPYPSPIKVIGPALVTLQGLSGGTPTIRGSFDFYDD